MSHPLPGSRLGVGLPGAVLSRLHHLVWFVSCFHSPSLEHGFTLTATPRASCCSSFPPPCPSGGGGGVASGSAVPPFVLASSFHQPHSAPGGPGHRCGLPFAQRRFEPAATWQHSAGAGRGACSQPAVGPGAGPGPGASLPAALDADSVRSCGAAGARPLAASGGHRFPGPLRARLLLPGGEV